MASPIDGVVTRVRSRGGVGTARVRIIRPAGASYLFAGTSPYASGDGTGITTVEGRVPIQAGDFVAIEAAPGAQASYRANPGSRSEYFEPAPADGAAVPPTFTPLDIEFLYNADIEPDRDGDGYGDETQDFCPNDASTQETCLPPADEPEAGRTLNVDEVSGQVFVKVPGTTTSGARSAQVPAAGFVPLQEAASIPMGSLVDVSKGVVRMTAANDLSGGTAEGKFDGGLFKVTQRRTRRPVTQLALRGDRSVCRNASGAGTARAQAARRISRLRGNGRGRFRTRGRHSSATVRGTRWYVEDRCDGTLTTVQSGVVIVRDFAKRRNVRLTRGGRYFARPRRR